MKRQKYSRLTKRKLQALARMRHEGDQRRLARIERRQAKLDAMLALAEQLLLEFLKPWNTGLIPMVGQMKAVCPDCLMELSDTVGHQYYDKPDVLMEIGYGRLHRRDCRITKCREMLHELQGMHFDRTGVITDKLKKAEREVAGLRATIHTWGQMDAYDKLMKT